MEGRRFVWLLVVCGALCISGALANNSKYHKKHLTRESVPFEPITDTSLCGQPDTYQCSSGDCIRNDQRCNGWKYECMDKLDEENCESCVGDAFYCTRTKKCIPASFKCDYDNDCEDLEDEEGCPCEFRCEADNRCIRSIQKCDGVPNCSDGQDEDGCPCEFRCEADNRCIRSIQKCDNVINCSDGQDEDGCPCDGFTCANKGCIPSEKRCDGSRYFCSDNSDETDCDSCTDTGFYCPTARVCIPANYKCDLYKDCQDGADEVGCPCPFFCEADQQCFKESAKCDGRPQCSDGADEADCPCDGFRCADKGCVDINSRCDGTTDCWDRSDELNCDQCSGDSFYCATDKKCIRSKWQCDGDRNDCPLGQEDENDCPVKL